MRRCKVSRYRNNLEGNMGHVCWTGEKRLELGNNKNKSMCNVVKTFAV